MELYLKTIIGRPDLTKGELSIEDALECFTLELPYIDGRVGTAIGPGRFQLRFEPSPHFLLQADDVSLSPRYRAFVSLYARQMPHIIIPARSLIMFHWGNWISQTKGCPLLGRAWEGDELIGSDAAFEQFYSKTHEEIARGNCFVTVSR